MATWAQIVNGQALNVIVATSQETSLAQVLADRFVPGYDGGYGVAWVPVPDGTLSGAATTDGVNFVNPAPVVIPTPVDPIAELQKQVAVLSQAIAVALPTAAQIINAPQNLASG